MDANPQICEYKEAASEIRKIVLRLIHETCSPHIGSSLSCVEILIALYFRLLDVSPRSAKDPNRDRFILSKGHACPTLYAVLYKKNFLSQADLDGFAQDGGALEHHPAMDLSRGIEISTGSLGHGLNMGTGMALAARIDGRSYRVFVLMSDGELNEGSNWEAIMFAGHHKLTNLIALVDANKIQALGRTKEVLDLEPFGPKWSSFGWHVQEIDGHDFEQIFGAFENLSSTRPNVIILHTVKGKGVSFMEDRLLWHYKSPDAQEYRIALEEIAK